MTKKVDIIADVAAAKKRVGRKPNPAPRDRVVLGNDVITRLDAVAAKVYDKLGFKPTLPQMIIMLINEHEGRESVLMVPTRASND